MIKFSNGYELTFCCGAGALGFDGKGYIWDKPFIWLGLLNPKKFTIVAKTITLEPLKGNLNWWHPWTCVRLIAPRSAVNAVGLTNPGLEHWLKKYWHMKQEDRYNIVSSFMVNNAKEALDIIHLMKRKHCFPYIELNISCPNHHQKQPIYSEILQVFRVLNIPLVLKLSEAQITKETIEETEEYVEAYHAINSIPYYSMFPSGKSPLEKYNLSGGVSGRLIKMRAREAVFKLSTLTKRPIIGGGGIEHIDDVMAIEYLGASAFSIGTLFIYKPYKPNQIIKQYNALQTIKRRDIQINNLIKGI